MPLTLGFFYCFLLSLWVHFFKHAFVLYTYSLPSHYIKMFFANDKLDIKIFMLLLFLSWFPAPLHGFAFWFDVEFNGPAIFPTSTDSPSLFIGSSSNNPVDGSQRKKRSNPNEALVLSTAPEDPPTHWQQVP